MVFASPIFLFVFLTSILFIYTLFSIFGNIHILNFILLVFSIIFYAYGCFSFLPIMFFSLFVNYILALLLEKYRNKTKRFVFVTIAVVFNLLIFFFYKYINLFLNIFIDINNFIFNGDNPRDIINITIPLGISFYTFQILSYVIDVYRKKVHANNNFFSLILYAMFFPQLIAGPIVRYKDVADSLKNRESNIVDIYTGIRRFAIGFIKKILFANYLGKISDYVFYNEYGSVGVLFAIIGLLAFTFQIFLDFSAYSDMAIGLARIFGFRFKENFNLPFLSFNTREVWERWHISLSSFFKDYVYIPLGGSRKGLNKRIRNLLIVFILSGFWHGASWNYVTWGLYNAVFVIIDTLIFYFCEEKLHINLTLISKTILVRPIGIVITFIIWTIGMILFKCETMDIFNAFMSNFNEPIVYSMTIKNISNKIFTPYFILVLIGTFGFSFGIFKSINNLLNRIKLYIILDILIFVFFLYAVIEMIAGGFNPFIYFRF